MISVLGYLVAAVFVAFVLIHLYDKLLGEDRRQDGKRVLPVQWRWLNCLYALTCGYFWSDCPRCGRMFGGHETGGIQGRQSTCSRCPASVGWFPWGASEAMQSRYFNGKDWEGDPVQGAYFEIPASRRPDAKVEGIEQ